MIAAHAAGIRGLRDGRDRRRPPRGPGRRGTRPPTLDISSDLEELGRTPMAVVCAGPKAILDVPATLEYLETRGVPVVTIGQAELPGFYARSRGLASPQTARDVARRGRGSSRVQLGLGLGGILVCVPAPAAEALPGDVARDAVERAIREADAAGIHGPATTPWLLAPDRRDHRRRVGPRQHGADRQRRQGRRAAGGRARLSGGGFLFDIRLHTWATLPFPYRSSWRTLRVPPQPVDGSTVSGPPSPSDLLARPARPAARDRRARDPARLQGQAEGRRRPRRRRPPGRAGRVLRPARPERRRQDDADQDPDDPAPAARGHGPDLRLRRRAPDQADPPDHEHGRRRRAVGLRDPHRPRAALDVQPVLRPALARRLAPGRRADRRRRDRTSSASSGSARCRPASARR